MLQSAAGIGAFGQFFFSWHLGMSSYSAHLGSSSLAGIWAVSSSLDI